MKEKGERERERVEMRKGSRNTHTERRRKTTSSTPVIGNQNSSLVTRKRSKKKW